MTPCQTNGRSESFPFDISGCHESCYPKAKFAGGASATCLKELLIELYTPQNTNIPVAMLNIKHKTVKNDENKDMLSTSVEWLQCDYCLQNWNGKVQTGKEISWYKPSDDSIEPWCLDIIEPSYGNNSTNKTGKGTRDDNNNIIGSHGNVEMNEKFQYIIRFWTKEKYETLRIHFDDLTYLPASALYQSDARIYTTHCYKEKACVLCGYYNDIPNDDFTYRIDYHDATSEIIGDNSDDFYNLSTTNADDPHNIDSWYRTQNFTVQWVNQGLSRELRPNSSVK